MKYDWRIGLRKSAWEVARVFLGAGLLAVAALGESYASGHALTAHPLLLAALPIVVGAVRAAGNYYSVATTPEAGE